MQSSLLQLLKNTFLYSGAQGFTRVITFVFLPITTAYLSIEDYGNIAALLIFGQLVNGLFTLGFGTTLFRFYNSLPETFKKHGLIWTCFLILALHGTVLSLFAYFFRDYLSWIVLGSSDKTALILFNVPTIALGAAVIPLTTYLRIENKYSLVFWLSMLEAVLSLSFVLFFLIASGKGVLGVVLGALIGQCVYFIAVMLICLFKMPFSLYCNPLPEMLKMGTPYIFGINGFLLALCANRYLLQGLADMDQVGLFFMGLNFTKGMELFLTGLTAAWNPLAFSYLHEGDQTNEFFEKAIHYYIAGVSVLALGCFVFAKPVIYMMVQPPFWPAWTTVGVVGLAYAFWGMYNLVSCILVYHKKTWLQVSIEAGTVFSCILIGLILVPLFFKEGAAWALCCACCITAFVCYLCGSKFLSVGIDKIKLVKLMTLFLAGAAASFLRIDDFFLYVLLMIFVFLAFCAYVWFGFIEAGQKAALYHLFKKKVQPIQS